jgi:heme exporter protein D
MEYGYAIVVAVVVVVIAAMAFVLRRKRILGDSESVKSQEQSKERTESFGDEGH